MEANSSLTDCFGLRSISSACEIVKCLILVSDSLLSHRLAVRKIHAMASQRSLNMQSV